jgi:SSS family solute:Na+ symporter
MNSYFSPGDWAVILLYLLGIIGLGLWFGKDQHNTRDYFLGSKNVPWWGIGLSIVAAETSALTIIGVPAMAYGGNIAFLQMIIGYVIARIILAIVLVPHYFKGEIYSPYQLFANTFGPSARQTAGGFFLISETLAAGVRVYVASIPVKLILGDKLLGFGTGDPILGAILLFVILSLLLHLRRRRQGRDLDGCSPVRPVPARRHLRPLLHPHARGWRDRCGVLQSRRCRQAPLAQRHPHPASP